MTGTKLLLLFVMLLIFRIPNEQLKSIKGLLVHTCLPVFTCYPPRIKMINTEALHTNTTFQSREKLQSAVGAILNNSEELSKLGRTKLKQVTNSLNFLGAQLPNHLQPVKVDHPMLLQIWPMKGQRLVGILPVSPVTYGRVEPRKLHIAVG